MTKVTISSTNFTAPQNERLMNAGKLLEQVLNSPEFAQEMQGFQYSYTSGALWWKQTYISKRFRWNNGDSNPMILANILDGNELNSGKDNEVDCQITLYTGDSGVLGYTYPSTLRTWINSYFFNTASLPEIAGNLTHEFCHKIGYGHEYYYSSLRQYTVPYAVGYLVVRLAKEFEAKAKIQLQPMQA